LNNRGGNVGGGKLRRNTTPTQRLESEIFSRGSIFGREDSIDKEGGCWRKKTKIETRQTAINLINSATLEGQVST